jgi:hypothetical protein
MPLCCRVCHALSAIYVDRIAVCTMMARPLPHGFLERLSIEAHDMETRIVTCAVRTFEEAVPPPCGRRMRHRCQTEAHEVTHVSDTVKGGGRIDAQGWLLRSVGYS